MLKGEITMTRNNISIANARILFRNFTGAAGRYNQVGHRNFCVLIDNDIAQELIDEGWGVKYLRPRDEGDVPQAYLQVNVSYKNIPPKIVLITSSGKTTMDEDTIGILDWAEIANVDLIIRPYNWEVNGNSGVKGYVKSMYVTLMEDEFESKYRDVPDSAQSSFVNYD